MIYIISRLYLRLRVEGTVPFQLIRQSRVTVPCGPALILGHVTRHFDFGRMRKMVQKKSFKIKISCVKTVYKASDTTIIINYAVKYSIFVGIPFVIMAPKSGVTLVLYKLQYNRLGCFCLFPRPSSL